VTKNGKVRVGTGYRVCACHEPVLLASFRGRPNHKAFPSIFDGLAQEHSRKPDEFYQIVLDRTPDQDRCDLFSRETRPGFAAGVPSTGSLIGWPEKLMMRGKRNMIQPAIRTSVTKAMNIAERLVSARATSSSNTAGSMTSAMNDTIFHDPRGD
jgi:hypothetical protein